MVQLLFAIALEVGLFFSQRNEGMHHTVVSRYIKIPTFTTGWVIDRNSARSGAQHYVFVGPHLRI